MKKNIKDFLDKMVLIAEKFILVLALNTLLCFVMYFVIPITITKNLIVRPELIIGAVGYIIFSTMLNTLKYVSYKPNKSKDIWLYIKIILGVGFVIFISLFYTASMVAIKSISNETIIWTYFVVPIICYVVMMVSLIKNNDEDNDLLKATLKFFPQYMLVIGTCESSLVLKESTILSVVIFVVIVSGSLILYIWACIKISKLIKEKGPNTKKNIMIFIKSKMALIIKFIKSTISKETK